MEQMERNQGVANREQKCHSPAEDRQHAVLLSIGNLPSRLAPCFAYWRVSLSVLGIAPLEPNHLLPTRSVYGNVTVELRLGKLVLGGRAC